MSNIIKFSLCISCAAAAIIAFHINSLNAQDIWVGKDGNIRNADTKAMYIGQDGMYLATKNEMYKARDMSDSWESVFSIPSGDNEISCLSGGPGNIFIGTRRGLFRSEDCGLSWKNVFRTIVPEKSHVTAIDTPFNDTRSVVIGTERGIFLSEDRGAKWKDISGFLKNRPVGCIAMFKGDIYIGSSDGLYMKKGSVEGWERLYISTAPNRDEETNDAIPAEEAESEYGGSGISCIAADGARLYIGTGKKILYSEDGKVWSRLTSQGISGSVNNILASSSFNKETLYCATTKGVFEYSAEKEVWLELYKGMEKRLNVKTLVSDKENKKLLWAVTDNGLYKFESGRYSTEGYVDVENRLNEIKITFSEEPGFKELQQAAIRFAEVSPDKIKSWRSQARMRALVPKVSFNTDKNRSTNYEIYTSATKDYVAAGPDDVSNGWGVSISWELGDMVWSDDQTSIDVRSKLMVQLRNDILDDLRRVYYERKRLQFELSAEETKDAKMRFEKELRLEELTQAIDDLTGNYFSEHNVKNKQ